jgi:recombination protein RecT
MEHHADQYSQAFSITAYRALKSGKIAQKDLWKYSSFWYKNFDEMAKKTMLRNLISRWGIMSIDLQEAYEKDTAVIGTDGTYSYVDAVNEQNPKVPVDIPDTPAAATVAPEAPTPEIIQDQETLPPSDDEVPGFFEAEHEAPPPRRK